MKKKQFKTLDQRAKEIASRTTVEVVDQMNWRIKEEWLTQEQKIEAMYKIFHFITIPDKVLNDTEKLIFTEAPDLFEQINVTKKN